MEHVHPLDRPFPWRAAALVAGVVALAELTALIALTGVRLLHVHHSTTSTPAVTAPARTGAKKPAALPLQPRSRVSVLVLNGNGVSGAAGTEAAQLLARGYRHALAADAPSTYAQSVVLFRPGWQREAQRLAHDAGIRAVTPLDVRLPRSDRGDQVVLILGAR
ncbi:MAG TPA: LytR C-terminal domain-containing protein [Gaiellaceae bacterium]|nr:LytR C-terminal domain-containing protein [Gaiellaceae bacterium]